MAAPEPVAPSNRDDAEISLLGSFMMSRMAMLAALTISGAHTCGPQLRMGLSASRRLGGGRGLSVVDEVASAPENLWASVLASGAVCHCKALIWLD
jgi:hypothetical protein